MVDPGRAATYFATSLEWNPSALKASTYLYVLGAAGAAATKGKLAAKASRALEAAKFMVNQLVAVTNVRH